MKVPFVDLKLQYRSIKTDIDRAAESVFECGRFIGGEFVHQFESTFASLLKVNHCIGVGNGTDAILIALKSIGIAPGDEVITPAFGWISSSEMITLAGGKPVFADILPETYTIDPSDIEARITPRTKGVVLIHLYGQAAHAHQIKRICEKNNLFLIEDCAQAHLTEENGISVGRIGDAGTFSFYPTKNLGAYGDAGCIITRRDDLEKKMRLYANHGGLHQHITEGINSRLDPLQASMLMAKCSYLPRWTDQRIAHAKLYTSLLAGVQQITLPKVRPYTTHTFHQFVIRVRRRDDLKNFLAENGIETVVHYPAALHNLMAYEYLKYGSDDFPVASQCQNEVLSLPVYPELSSDQIAYVCDAIKTFFAQPL